MHIRTAAVGTVVGLALVLVSATPALAQVGSTNLLSASGVTFVPSQDEAVEVALAEVTVPLRFETPMAMAHAFVQTRSDDPHTMAIGARSGGYAYGIGGLLRWWYSKLLFIDVGFARHGYSSYLSHTIISGTVNYVFKEIDTSDVVVVRLYAGGGISIVRWSWDEQFYGNDYDSTAIGGHGLVGVELVFKQFPKIAIGGDAGFYSSNGNYFNYGGYGGFGSSIYFLWYFK